MKDTQRKRVYRWEESQWWWSVNGTLVQTIDGLADVGGTGPEEFRNRSLETLEAIARGISRLPNLTIERTNNIKARGLAETQEVLLPPWAQTVPLMCHEVAHVLAGEDHGHGPDFVGHFCRLLDRAGIGTEAAHRRSAIDAGLRVT